MVSDKKKRENENTFKNEGQSASHSSPQDNGADALLNEVLKQTEQASQGGKLFEILVKFCAIHSDRNELDQELMNDIVDMILKHKFPRQEFPAGCSEWVAEVLFYDPESRQRVESVWNQALNQVG